MTTGKFITLEKYIPAKKYWECGDGCCSGWEVEDVYFPIGTVIKIDDDYDGYFSDETYSLTGCDDEDGTEILYEYRCEMTIAEYISHGYVKETE